MNDKLSFLSGHPEGHEPVQPEPIAPARPAAPEPQEADPASDRSPDGRFLPQGEASPPASTPEPARTQAPLSEKETVGFFNAMQAEREKRQAAERQLAELKSKAELKEPAPIDQQLRQALYEQNLRASRRFAEREYGKDRVRDVHEWAAAECDRNPAFNQQMLTSDDPYEAAFQAFDRNRVLETVKPDDLDAFIAWRAAQAASHGNPTPAPPSAAEAPPKSLATAPGNGAAGKPHIPVGPGQAFMATIPR